MYDETNVNVSKYIIDFLSKKGIKQNWLAKQLGVSKSTISYKLKEDTFTAKELVYVANLLDIDLNSIKINNEGV